MRTSPEPGAATFSLAHFRTRARARGCRATGFAAKQNQAKPNQAKLNQAILLGLIWFYSSESGLFNGLQRIQIKNSLPVSGVERGFSTGRSLLFAGQPPRRLSSSNRNMYSTGFRFRPENVYLQVCSARRIGALPECLPRGLIQRARSKIQLWPI